MERFVCVLQEATVHAPIDNNNSPNTEIKINPIVFGNDYTQ